MNTQKSTFSDKIFENLTQDVYQTWYKQSIESPDQFWAEQAQQFISWYEPWTKVVEADFKDGIIKWFIDAKLNVSVNCIDRHLPHHADKTAILWESDDPNEHKAITFQELHDHVCQFANVLKKMGVKKGDRVCLYLPMIPESAFAMLACARIGAIHSVVFGGFSSNALRDRILDAQAEYLITADISTRGGKQHPLKEQADKALQEDNPIKKVFVIKTSDTDIPFNAQRDCWLLEEARKEKSECEPEVMDAEDPLFILYTSGSTGKPKGVLHTTGGYLTYAAMTFRYIFNYQPEDIFWCTADIGWITGHTYVVYGPLALGATTVMFEGIPTYPTSARFWEVIDKHKVNIFYTAPTAIRALMAKGDKYVKGTSRDTLKLLGTVGEPINPEAWRWYHNIVGNKNLEIVDTWWQTETGGILISPLPNVSRQQPGSVGMPFFGVLPKILDDNGDEVEKDETGLLTIKCAWPGMMRTVYKNHERFIETYFSKFPGYYLSGDGAKVDKYGEYWITGRVDDVINISGHRIGTAEVESALVLHHAVAEAAVVGISDPIKGQNLYAFVTLADDIEPSKDLEEALRKQVQEVIGKIAIPKVIQWAPNLPKTRSGKIMRRILRKLANDEFDQIGDTSTLADPSVLEQLKLGKEAIQSTGSL